MSKFSEKVKGFPWGYLLFAVTFIAIGVCFIVFTTQTIDVMCYLIGGVTILAAVVNAVFALAKKQRGGAFYVKIILCVFAVISGVIVMIKKDDTLEIITTVVSLMLIIDCSFKLQTVIKMRANKVAIWWTMIAFIIVGYAGNTYLLKFYNAENLQLMLGVLGGMLILDGVMNLLMPIYLSAIKKHKDEKKTVDLKQSIPDSLTNENAQPVEIKTEEPIEEGKETENKVAEEKGKEEVIVNYANDK